MKNVFGKGAIVRYLPWLLVCFLVPVLAFGQDAGSFLSGLENQMTGMRETVITVVRIAIGVAATVYVAINLVKYFRGQGDSQNSLIRVVVGVVMALVLMGALNLLR